jgi:hypothetical protein
MLRDNAAQGEPDDELPCAQTPVDEQAAVIRREERGIPRAAAAEHGQTEHARFLIEAIRLHKRKAAR